jgi:predicted DNA-binding helix-hairpin-helix protein
VDRIVASRRWRRLHLDDVARLTVSIAKVRPFIIARTGAHPAHDRADLKQRLRPKKEQLELFAA